MSIAKALTGFSNPGTTTPCGSDSQEPHALQAAVLAKCACSLNKHFLNTRNMGRNPLPYELQDAKGYFQEHPSRERKPAVVTRPLGSPPKELDDVHKEMWKTIAKQLPAGVAKFSDRLMFEALVRAAVKMRNGTARGVDIQQLVSIGSHFGLSPVARMKVGAAQESPKDELDELLVKPKPNRTYKHPTPLPDATKSNF